MKEEKRCNLLHEPVAGIEVSEEQWSGEKIRGKKIEYCKFGNMQVIEENPNSNPDLS